MDVANVIQSLLENNWNLSNITPIYRQLEFDPKSPALQILLEVFPARTTWVISGMYKVEHRLRITLYKKLIHYAIDDIEAYKTEWFSVKAEIDRILRENKFSVEGINNIILGTWEDSIPSMRVGRGSKGTREPIIWTSTQIPIIVYYFDSGLVTI